MYVCVRWIKLRHITSVKHFLFKPHPLPSHFNPALITPSLSPPSHGFYHFSIRFPFPLTSFFAIISHPSNHSWETTIALQVNQQEDVILNLILLERKESS